MAKNLKLNIKNAQLAEVLKKSSKLKKSEGEDTVKEKPLPSESEAIQSTTPQAEKRVVRAKKLPSGYVPPKVEKEETPPVIAEKPTETPVNKEAESVKLPPKEEEVVSAPVKQEVKAKEEPPAVSKKSETASPTKEEELEAEKKQAKDKKKGKKGEPGKEKDESFHEAKQKKGVQTTKRQAFSRVFDTRDQNGLRAEEETWRRRRQQKQPVKKNPELVQRPKEITVRLPISVKDLAAMMKLKSSDLIQKFFMQGLLVTINDVLEDPTVVELIGYEYDCKINIDTTHTERLQITDKSIREEIAETDSSLLISRPPVVTIMGHVDHGKTSIIDAFRKSNIIAGEAGAITQHIGAFQCKTKHGLFTVLDTPGHEAFSAIRQRGAHVTDIVVLVVAGDEGIKMQTDEAIQKAKDAKVPIIVAINKMDKPGFNPDEIYRQLSERNLLPEAWGGEVITVNCSAKTKEGIEYLAEMIALQSDILELKANPNTRARGTVLESELHRGLGPSATLLVQNGTLKLGDPIIFEHVYGRIKTMQDEHGHRVKEALPSTPVKITGLSGVPSAGNEFIALTSEKEARKIAEERQSTLKSHELRQSRTKNIEHLMKEQAALKEVKVLNLIIKADVGGSLEAIKTTLLKIPTEKVKLHFIHAGVGQISESDIQMAETSNAIIVGFHTNVESHAESMIKKSKVTVLLHDVIYHLVDDVKAKMLQILDKIRLETEVGVAKVLEVFKSSQLGLIAGCQVIDGIVKRSHHVKVFRDDALIWQGSIASLKRHKDDVKEVKKDIECGICFEGFSDVKQGDIIKTYDITFVAQEL